MADARELGIPGWFRTGFQLTARAAPGLASSWAMNLFFTPRRVAMRKGDQTALQQARRFSLEGRRGTLVGWSWGSGPPVLLVHGWAGYAGQLSTVAQALAASGHRALALDMPAHGASNGRRASIVHFADAIADAARLFGPFHGLVGHSLGAAAVTLALHRGDVAAARVAFVAPPADLELFWARFRRGMGMSSGVWEGMRERSEQWLGVPFEEVRPVRLAPRMSTPLLILHDRDDKEIPISEAQALRAAWPGAELQETERLGHVRLLRDPALAARVTGFIAARSS